MKLSNDSPRSKYLDAGVQRTQAILQRRLAAFSRLTTGDPVLWVETNLRLPKLATSKEGRVELIPWQREILRSICRPGTTVLKIASQMGKTLLEILAMLFWIDQDPCAIGVLYPTGDRAKEWMKEKFITIADASPKFARLVGSSSFGQEITQRRFPGGFISAVGSNSPSAVAQKTLERVIIDEVDRLAISAGKEGDPLRLFLKRTEKFRNSIAIISGTPTIEGESKIETWLEESDQRTLPVNCRHCNHPFVMDWDHVDYKPEAVHDARIKCPNCDYRHTDEERRKMVLEKEVWTPTRESLIRGFELNALYDTFPHKADYSGKIHQLVAEWITAVKEGAQAKRVFTNTVLNKVSSDEVEQVEPEPIKNRREAYNCDVPAGVLVLICAVDVQERRLELELIGFGEDEESWGIEKIVIPGNPKTPNVWRKLTEILDKPRQYADGRPVKIAATGIDSGGHATKEVYQYAKNSYPRRVWAIKGHPTPGMPVATESKKKRLLLVGTDTIKETLFARMKLDAHGPGFMHYPQVKANGEDRGYDDDYFNQLTAERALTVYEKNKRKRTWVKKKKGARNEALDIRVYAIAVISALNPRWKVLKKVREASMAVQAVPTMQSPDNPPDMQPNVLPKKFFRSKGGKWGGGFKP